MLYEVTKTNSLGLFQYFQELGFKGSKSSFDKELLNGGSNYQRTYVYEVEGRIVSYIQYGKNSSGNGYIRLFDYKEGFEYAAQEVLFRAATYFYMFHLNSSLLNCGLELDKVFDKVNVVQYKPLFEEFNIKVEGDNFFKSKIILA